MVPLRAQNNTTFDLDGNWMEIPQFVYISLLSGYLVIIYIMIYILYEISLYSPQTTNRI